MATETMTDEATGILVRGVLRGGLCHLHLSGDDGETWQSMAMLTAEALSLPREQRLLSGALTQKPESVRQTALDVIDLLVGPIIV